MEKLKVRSSSGSSKVFESKEESTIVQKFESATVAKRIATIMIKLLELKKVSYEIKLQKGFGPKKEILLYTTLNYGPFEYIVSFQYYIEEDKTIVWEKIAPLNSSKFLLSAPFLEKNVIKICYDIFKALTALKKINIVHNDCVLDNIGIRKNNFVLFDFDGSGTPEEKGKDFSDDIRTLLNSFKFRDVNIPKFTSIGDIIGYVMNARKITAPFALVYLEELPIQYDLGSEK